MADIRVNAITLKGNPIHLVGKELKPGDSAPDFCLLTNGLDEVCLKSYAGKTLIIASLPSLDTPVCQLETKNFNEQAKDLPNVQVLVVSTDLPFGQKRWCGAEGVQNVASLSSHRDTRFGQDYGVLIAGGKFDRIYARAIFVVGTDGKLKHVEYVKEIAEQPNFEAALAAAKA